MSSSAPIVPTKVLGDPEELERHLAMHQNGGFPANDLFAAGVNDSDANPSQPASEAFDARFIFTPPTLELEQSDVQLHVSYFYFSHRVKIIDSIFLFFYYFLFD